MDRISVRGLRAMGRHGWAPGERERVQAFDIELNLQVDLQRAALSDDLSDTVDYAALCARIAGVVEGTSFALLERLAAEVLDAIFSEACVAGAAVTIAKPGILGGATPSVTLQRSNPNYERR
jgi:dihydroneopterin aldolase